MDKLKEIIQDGILVDLMKAERALYEVVYTMSDPELPHSLEYWVFWDGVCRKFLIL